MNGMAGIAHDTAIPCIHLTNEALMSYGKLVTESFKWSSVFCCRQFPLQILLKGMATA
jgi:hypothetical protein